MTSHKASQAFIDKVPAEDKKITLYEVRDASSSLDCSDILQGGFHELVSEPDGVWEKFTDECISWVEARIPAKL